MENDNSLRFEEVLLEEDIKFRAFLNSQRERVNSGNSPEDIVRQTFWLRVRSSYYGYPDILTYANQYYTVNRTTNDMFKNEEVRKFFDDALLSTDPGRINKGIAEGITHWDYLDVPNVDKK